jgi:hypothetical protein
MFSKPERDTTTTKRRITPELIQPYPSTIDLSAVESTPVPENEKEQDPPENKEEEQSECVICYESLNIAKNFCVTECGHKFCFLCMMKHAQRSNDCPLCRTVMINEIYDSDDEEIVINNDSDSDSNDSDDDETIDEETSESYPEFEIEKFVEAFEAKGYGLKDALSLLLHKFSKTDEKFTKAYVHQLDSDVEDICEELQNECEEREDMAAEDETR